MDRFKETSAKDLVDEIIATLKIADAKISGEYYRNAGLIVWSGLAYAVECNSGVCSMERVLKTVESEDTFNAFFEEMKVNHGSSNAFEVLNKTIQNVKRDGEFNFVDLQQFVVNLGSLLERTAA